MDEESLLPDKCPVCGKVKTNLLLHIQKSDSCKQVVDPKLYEKWKRQASKRKKRKYQEKYRKIGKEREASKKFYKKCIEDDEESFKQIIKRDNCKYYSRNKRSTSRKAIKSRLRRFNKFCSICFGALSYGRTPYISEMNKFHLVEADFVEKFHEELLNWVKEVNRRLLETIIQFQQIVLMTKSRWLSAMKKVKDKEDEIFILKVIGKLQAYKNENTKEIQIPDDFKSSCKITEMRHEGFFKRRVAKKDEDYFISLMTDILIDQEKWKDEKLQKLLRTRKAMVNLNLALRFHDKLK